MRSVCMFDIDSTLSRYGYPMNLSVLKEAIAMCKRHDCSVMTNTNRPFGYPFELAIFGVKFDGHYGNSNFFSDWLRSREHVSKIKNMDLARGDVPRNHVMLIDDNLGTLRKCRREGFSTLCVGKSGFDEESLEKLRRWLYRT